MKKLFFPLVVFLTLSVNFNTLAQSKTEKKIAKLEAKLEALKSKIPNTPKVPPTPNKPKIIELPAPVQKTTVEGITEYHLSNGLKVLLAPDPSQETITVNITYLVGSRHEGYGETGMAHLLEHMVFKGTPRHPDIPAELSEHGARPNGTTWLDRTNYYETFTATDENLNWALDMEADRMVNSFIKKEDLQSEFSVVRNEFEMGENNANSVLRERITSAAYLWHNYGNSTIGSREDIERVPIDRLQAFYKKYYQPDNAVLVVAGKFDPKSTLALVNKYFGIIPRPDRKLPKTYTKEPTQDGERSVVLRRVGDVYYLGALYHVAPGTHEDFAALDVLVDIVKNEPSGPLYKALVESKLASSMFGYVFGLRDPGSAYFGVEVPKDKDIEKANEVFLQTLDDVQSMEISPKDVDRAKTQTAKVFSQISRNTEGFARNLSEYIAKGDWRTYFLFRDAVEKVTVEDVQRVAAKYFKPSNRTFGKFIPEEEPDRTLVPEAPNVEDLVNDYKGREMMAQGEVFDPSPSNIDDRSFNGTASNGMKFTLLPKSTKGGVVTAAMTMRVGSEESLFNKSMISSLTASMLMRGSKNLDRQSIKDSLDKMETSVRMSGRGSTVSINISSTKEHLDGAMDLIADVLKNPKFDKKEYETLMQETKARYESQLSEPMALASNAYSRAISNYPKGHVNYSPTFKESLEMMEGISLDQLKAFHKNFYGTNNATISIVGDFNKDKITQILGANLGDWNSEMPFVRIPKKHFKNPNASEAIKTPDKPNALFLAGINLPIKDDHPDYPALVMGNYILGGGFLNSRLATRIRQKDGLSYGVGSQLQVSSLDESSNFTAYAIYAPENAQKLEAAFAEEIEKVRNEGFSEEELNAAIEGYLQNRKVSRAKDNELSGKLNNYAFLGRTMSFDAMMDKAIAGLDVSTVNNTFRKYVDMSKITTVKAGDFDKKFQEEEQKKPKAASVSSGD